MKKLATLFLLFLLVGTAQAQMNDSLVVLFASQPGVRLARIFADGFESGDTSALLDANGDGRPDLILTNEDNQGNLQDLFAIDPAFNDTLIRVLDVQTVLGASGQQPYRFRGFADADADGFREATFANDVEVAIVDPRDPQVVNWRSSFNIGFPPELRLLGITDMTDDGFAEIVVVLPQERQVIVFSDNPATTARR